MKPALPLAALLITFAAAPAHADTIDVGGKLLTGKIKTVQPPFLTLAIADTEKKLRIADCRAIEITGEPAFNKAEAPHKDGKTQADDYAGAIASAGPLARRIAQVRAIPVFVNVEKYAEATTTFLDLVLENPVADIWPLHPDYSRAKSAAALASSAAAVESRLADKHTPGVQLAIYELQRDIAFAAGNIAAQAAINATIPVAADPSRVVSDTRDKSEIIEFTQPLTDQPAVVGDTVFFSIDSAGAQRNAYVIDYSGSMVNFFDFARDEIRNSVRLLAPERQLNIISFSEKSDTLFPAKTMVPATPENIKTIVDQVAARRAAGKNDDSYDPFAAALTDAFACKPDIIYFLTDLDVHAKLPALAAKLNAQGKTKIHAVALSSKTDDLPILHKITKNSGGTFRYAWVK